MKKAITIQLLIAIAIICLPAILHAQPGFTDDTSDVPIDGGLSLLVAAGVGYGAKRLKNRKAKN
jgi:hypothetical protein